MLKQNIIEALREVKTDKEAFGATLFMEVPGFTDPVTQTVTVADIDKFINMLAFSCNGKGEATIFSGVKIVDVDTAYVTVEEECEQAEAIKELISGKKLYNEQLPDGHSIRIAKTDGELKVVEEFPNGEIKTNDRIQVKALFLKGYYTK